MIEENQSGGVASEMPKYRSHKEVWALKISVMEFTEDGTGKLSFENDRYAPIEIPNFREKFNGDYDDTGYLVVYQDGYKSWSPTKAFEEGYTLINKSMSFQYINPTDEQKALMQEFRDKFETLANEMREKVPASRGLSSAMTKLEESAFWLNKGITHND